MNLPITKPGVDGQIFKRQTVIDSAYALTTLGHSGFDRVLLELGMNLPESRPSLDDRANALAQLVFTSPDIQTPLGQRLDIALILYAGRLLESASFSRARVLKKVPNFVGQLRLEGIDLAAPADKRDDFDPDGNITGGQGGFNIDTFNSAAFDGTAFARETIFDGNETTFDGGARFSDGGAFEDRAETGSPAYTPSYSDGLGVAQAAGTIVGTAVVSGAGSSINWPEISAPIFTRLDEIDAVLRELVPLARQIVAMKAESGGMGHNNPPPDQMLSLADLDEAATAATVAREQLQKPDSISASSLRLSEKVLARIGELAKWMTGVGKMGVEEFVKAAAQQAGKRAVDVVYYLKIVGALAAAAAAAAVALHAIPI
jgi:hypothetical protein